VFWCRSRSKIDARWEPESVCVPRSEAVHHYENFVEGGYGSGQLSIRLTPLPRKFFNVPAILDATLDIPTM
jgi:hypothetical protein